MALGTTSSPGCPAWDLVQNPTAPQGQNFHGGQEEAPAHSRIAGALTWHLPSAALSSPLAVGRGCEVAASCFAHLEDQLWFLTHIFLQLRGSGRDVPMITGQAAASPQLPLILTSRGCSRALEGHLHEADAWKRPRCPAEAMSGQDLCLPAPALTWMSVGWRRGGVFLTSSQQHLLISLHISCSFLCRR